MTVTNVDKDFERLTLTVTAEFAATSRAVHDAYANRIVGF